MAGESTTTAKPAYTNPIGDLTSLLDLYSGKTTKSTTSPETTTSTTKSNMTAEQTQAAIDSAMAPLNVASHGAGLSAYSDTNLALGRAQVAAEIAAKNAGTTTTQTSSGRTQTSTTPGALSSSQIGQTVKGLALTQLGAPILDKIKKSGAMTNLTDAVSNKATDILSPITTAFTNMIGQGNAGTGLDLGASALNLGASSFDLSSMIPDTLSNGLSALANSGVAESVASNVIDTGDITSSALDWLFSNGGQVNTKKSLGYADGGMVDSIQDSADGGDSFAEGGKYIDRFVKSSNLTDPSIASPKLSASGEIAPATSTSTIAKTNADAVTQYLQSQGGQSFREGQTPADTGFDAPPGTLAARDMTRKTPGLSDTSVSNVAMTALTMANPILGLLASKVMDVPTLQKLAINDVANVFSDGTSTDPLGDFIATHVADNSPSVSISTGRYGGSGGNGFGSGYANSQAGAGDTSSGGTSPGGGATANAASGGKMSGPGTGTSDSINAKLSDGETVITAKTTEKAKELFGDDFFHKLEQMFNAPAAAAQVAQGRV